MNTSLQEIKDCDSADLDEYIDECGLQSILDKRRKQENVDDIFGPLDFGEGFVPKEQQPEDLIPLKAEDQFLVKDKQTMYYNLQQIGCVLPSINYCSAGFLANITLGRKLVPHKNGVEGYFIKWLRHKESMKFKEASIQVWINQLDQFPDTWKLYLPQRILENYVENSGKEVEEMEIKAFDTKWFIGVLNPNHFYQSFLQCLRSIHKDIYMRIVAAQRLIRLQNQNKNLTSIKPQISSKILSMIKQEQSSLKPVGWKRKMKKKVSSLQGFSKVERKKITISKNIFKIRKMLKELPESQSTVLTKKRRKKRAFKKTTLSSPMKKLKLKDVKEKEIEVEEESKENKDNEFIPPQQSDSKSKRDPGKTSKVKFIAHPNITAPVTRFQTKKSKEAAIHLQSQQAKQSKEQSQNVFSQPNISQMQKIFDQSKDDYCDELKSYLTSDQENQD